MRFVALPGVCVICETLGCGRPFGPFCNSLTWPRAFRFFFFSCPEVWIPTSGYYSLSTRVIILTDKFVHINKLENMHPLIIKVFLVFKLVIVGDNIILCKEWHFHKPTFESLMETLNFLPMMLKLCRFLTFYIWGKNDSVVKLLFNRDILCLQLNYSVALK